MTYELTLQGDPESVSQFDAASVQSTVADGVANDPNFEVDPDSIQVAEGTQSCDF